MAIDHIVMLMRKPPQDAELERMLNAYLGGTGTVEPLVLNPGTVCGAWLASLGRSSFVLTGRAAEAGRPGPETLIQPDRIFEVYLDDHRAEGPSVDVVTRFPDEFTEAVAVGFWRLVARWFEGMTDPTSQERIEVSMLARPPRQRYLVRRDASACGGHKITCMECFMTSWNPNDVENCYCGKCKQFLNDPLPLPE